MSWWLGFLIGWLGWSLIRRAVGFLRRYRTVRTDYSVRIYVHKDGLVKVVPDFCWTHRRCLVIYMDDQLVSHTEVDIPVKTMDGTAVGG